MKTALIYKYNGLNGVILYNRIILAPLIGSRSVNPENVPTELTIAAIKI